MILYILIVKWAAHKPEDFRNLISPCETFHLVHDRRNDVLSGFVIVMVLSQSQGINSSVVECKLVLWVEFKLLN